MERRGDDWFEEDDSGEGGWVDPSSTERQKPFDPGSQRRPDPLDTAERLRLQVELDTGEREQPRRGIGRGRRRRRERTKRRAEEAEGERHPPPSSWLARHRELPASVRRRQAALAGGVVAAVLVGGIVLASGGGGDEEEQALPVKRLVGQTMVGKVPNGGPNERLIRRVRRGQLGSIIVRDDKPRRLRDYVARLQEAARSGGNPPLLVMIDQEGGPVERLPGPPETGPAELGRQGSAEAAREEGRKTGAFLRSLGVDVNLAPVLDVAVPQTAESIASRTFGDDPGKVAELGIAFAEGLQSQRVAATAKHFPGLGLATVNTDFGEVTIAARREQLQAALEPFRSAVEAGVELVMVATAKYPALGAREPAAISPRIVRGELRDRLGFSGVIITDDLEAPAISSQMNPGAAAIASIRAGCDLALLARSVRGSARAFDAVVRAAKAGRLERSALEAAYERIAALKSSVARR